MYEAIGLEDESRPFVLYLGQFFPKAEFGEALYQNQIDLTKFAGESPETIYSVIKSHPQEHAPDYFSRADLLQGAGPSVKIIDRGGHTETVEVSTLIYYSKGVVKFSSTAAIEAMMMGRPAAIVENGLASPLSDGRIASIPSCTNHFELTQILDKGVDSKSFENFVTTFLPGEISGQYTSC